MEVAGSQLCVCVWLKFERAFSTRSSPARNGFVSSSITRSSSNQKLVQKPPKKEQKLGKKVSVKLDFKLGWSRKEYRNKAEMKERKKTTLHLVCIFADVGQSSCVLSSLPCFCTFFGSIPNLKSSFTETFFPQYMQEMVESRSYCSSVNELQLQIYIASFAMCRFVQLSYSKGIQNQCIKGQDVGAVRKIQVGPDVVVTNDAFLLLLSAYSLAAAFPYTFHFDNYERVCAMRTQLLQYMQT